MFFYSKTYWPFLYLDTTLMYFYLTLKLKYYCMIVFLFFLSLWYKTYLCNSIPEYFCTFLTSSVLLLYLHSGVECEDRCLYLSYIFRYVASMNEWIWEEVLKDQQRLWERILHFHYQVPFNVEYWKHSIILSAASFPSLCTKCIYDMIYNMNGYIDSIYSQYTV